MRFYKYHALGNDYIVLNPVDGWQLPDAATIHRICHPHYGISGDGILYGPITPTAAHPAPAGDSPLPIFALLIFNPDGSIAEKSGNGLRIFARYLWDQQQAGVEPFTLLPTGGPVRVSMAADGCSATLDLGQVSFSSSLIPVRGAERQVVNESLHIPNGDLKVSERELRFCALTLGNPHCVILLESPPTPELARRLGPYIENHPLFPKRTNVQFLYIHDRSHLQIEIWERGVGYTLASGTSSAAAATVAYHLGACQEQVAVHMPGGVIQVQVQAGLRPSITGTVSAICQGELQADFFEEAATKTIQS